MNWEYKSIKLGATGFFGRKVDESELDATMNALGLDGWELAVALDTSQIGGETKDIVAIFKRPVEN